MSSPLSPQLRTGPIPPLRSIAPSCRPKSSRSMVSGMGLRWIACGIGQRVVLADSARREGTMSVRRRRGPGRRGRRGPCSSHNSGSVDFTCGCILPAETRRTFAFSPSHLSPPQRLRWAWLSRMAFDWSPPPAAPRTTRRDQPSAVQRAWRFATTDRPNRPHDGQKWIIEHRPRTPSEDAPPSSIDAWSSARPAGV